jgi:hypothetical protein
MKMTTAKILLLDRSDLPLENKKVPFERVDFQTFESVMHIDMIDSFRKAELVFFKDNCNSTIIKVLKNRFAEKLTNISGE